MWLERLVGDANQRLERGYYETRPGQTLAPFGSLRMACQRAYPALVAEIKPGRPGEAPREVDVEAIAAAYAEGGACGISVLVDPDHFGGSLFDLQRARTGGLPLLFKDFVVDQRQLDAAAAWGASCVLAIVRVFDETLATATLDELVAAAHARELEVLAEVFNGDELDRALASGADLIGINARDLDTLKVDTDRTRRVLDGRNLTQPVLHLSGVRSRADVVAAMKAGAQGVLVGTSLMEAEDPAAATRALVDMEGGP